MCKQQCLTKPRVVHDHASRTAGRKPIVGVGERQDLAQRMNRRVSYRGTCLSVETAVLHRSLLRRNPTDVISLAAARTADGDARP